MANGLLGNLNVRQGHLSEAKLQDRPYDLIWSVVSWEARSSAAGTLFRKLGMVPEVLWFDSQSSEIDRLKQQRFAEMCNAAGQKLSIARLANARSFEANFTLLEALIRERYVKTGRPLRVAVDITCMPKRYLLFLLGLGYRQEFFARFDCVYSEGKYQKLERPIGTTFGSAPAVDGDWVSLQVPYLESECYIPDESGLVVSLGASEFSLSAPFIERFEPRAITLLFLRPEAHRIPADSIEAERRTLKEIEYMPITQAHQLDLIDVIGTARTVLEALEADKGAPFRGLAIGCKPHALAMGLAALAVTNLEVVCRVPPKYQAVDVLPTGRILLFETEDRFEPAAYS